MEPKFYRGVRQGSWPVPAPGDDRGLSGHAHMDGELPEVHIRRGSINLPVSAPPGQNPAERIRQAANPRDVARVPAREKLSAQSWLRREEGYRLARVVY
ncbi:MAG: hypothetical protein AAGU11_04145 [Syntrophobacteraceae bacterium]